MSHVYLKQSVTSDRQLNNYNGGLDFFASHTNQGCFYLRKQSSKVNLERVRNLDFSLGIDSTQPTPWLV